MWRFLFVLGGLFLVSSEGYTLFESYLYFDDLFTTDSKGIPWIVCWKITRCEVLPCIMISKILGIMVQKKISKNECLWHVVSCTSHSGLGPQLSFESYSS